MEGRVAPSDGAVSSGIETRSSPYALTLTELSCVYEIRVLDVSIQNSGFECQEDVTRFLLSTILVVADTGFTLHYNHWTDS
jgi:hypothetical protein